MKNTPLRRSREQEKRIAKRHDGQLSSGSGNGWLRKNDVRTDGILWEMKRTDRKSITLKDTDLEELRKNALLEGRMPAMHVEIGKRRYVVLTENDFEGLMINGAL